MTAANGAAKQASNWIMGDVLGALNRTEKDITESPITPVQLGGLIARIADNTISGKIAKQVFQALMDGEGASADEIIEKKGLKQESDSGAIEALIDEVITANPDNVTAYRSGIRG